MTLSLMASVLTLTNLCGSVSVDTFGGRVTSYVPAGGEEVLATLQDGSGGIALCWPWFANDGPEGCRRHGLARYREFDVVGRTETPRQSELVLRLVSDADTRRAFPHDFALTVTVRLGETLTVELCGENTGTTPFRVTEMLHPYFRVGSARECRVRGLDGCRYRDNVHPELGDGRIWAGEYAVAEGSKVFAFAGGGGHRWELVDPVLSRVLTFSSSGDLKTVVWSPGEASGKGRNVTSKLAPGEWRTFVCVENGTCYGDRAYELKPGARHVLRRTIRAAQSLTPDRTEVLVAPQAETKQRAAFFAAEEMTNFLSRVFGRIVPLVRKPSADKVAIVLGTNGWSEAAGIDISDLSRDAFIIRTAPRRIYIAGRDDRAFRPFVGEYDKEIGTLYGAYEFLERFAGCRFYFPGELGEVVPRREEVVVPATDRVFAPDWRVRKISHQLGAWFEPLDKEGSRRVDRLFRYRLRHQTQGIPCCHGLGMSNFSVRFGKAHPEYFQLKNGKRCNVWKDDTPQYYHSMLCHSSGIWDEVYRDARSYFLGEGPEVRGLMHGENASKFRCSWGWHVSGGKYYDAMPQDGMSKCECPACQTAYAQAKDPNDWANELIWGNTVRLANRLKADGFTGQVTQMAYHPYRNVPDVDIPDNVLVMVCSNGSWVRPDRLEKDLETFRAWNRKRNGNIWLWNNTGKHRCFQLNIADLPCVTPRAFGRFYRDVSPLVFGAYCSNNAEKFLYSALNYYVFCKVAWDNRTDVDALLDECYRLMFGSAAEPMRRFLETVEEKWMTRVIGNAVETPLGTMTAAPTAFEVWKDIYPMAEVRELGRLFDAALVAVPADSLEARRVALLKRELYDPMVPKSSVYEAGAAERELARRAAHPQPSVVKGFRPVTIEVTDAMRNVDVYDRRFKLDVKPGGTYRVSYFLTCENVCPYPAQQTGKGYVRRPGGVQCAVQTGSKASTALCTVGTGVHGTFGRMLQTGEVTFPNPLPEGASPQIVLRMYNRTGKALFEDLLVEEEQRK